MAKNKKAKPNNDQQNVKVIFPESMSKAEMIDVLSSAIFKADEMKAENEAKKQRQEDEEWQKKVGIKDYSNRKWLSRIVLSFCNTIACFFRIMFMPKKEIRGNRATNGLMKLAVQIIFNCLKIVLWGTAVLIFLSFPVQFVFPGAISYIALPEYFKLLPFAFISMVLAQLFRMAGIEIEKMKDKNYIVDIFAAIIAVIAIVVSLLLR